MKKIFIIFILVMCLTLTSCNLGHIEDTNGDESFELSTLSKDEIFTYNTSTTVGVSEVSKNSSFTFKCKKLSGNYLIKTLTPRDRFLKVTIDFNITDGNAFLALVCDKEVIYEIPYNKSSVYNISGSKNVQLRILGESCNVSISMNISEE